MTTSEVAEMLGVSTSTVHDYRISGLLPAQEIATPDQPITKRYSFSLIDVQAFMLTMERWGGSAKHGWRPRMEAPPKPSGLPPEIEKQAELLWQFIEPRLRQTIKEGILDAFE